MKRIEANEETKKVLTHPRLNTTVNITENSLLIFAQFFDTLRKQNSQQIRFVFIFQLVNHPPI